MIRIVRSGQAACVSAGLSSRLDEVLVDFAGRGSTQKPILVGASEGAGSVLAATSPRVRSAIAGVIGLGLPDNNELGWRWKDALIYG